MTVENISCSISTCTNWKHLTEHFWKKIRKNIFQNTPLTPLTLSYAYLQYKGTTFQLVSRSCTGSKMKFIGLDKSEYQVNIFLISR